jgi:hypothetical protein
MGFSSKNVVVNNQVQPTPAPEPTSNPPASFPELGLEEVEFLLKMLGNADLKGHQVEMFYNMIIKLQNMYLQKSKK